MEIVVARQPVFDRTENLVAYDLMLAGDGTSPREALPERLFVDAFLGVGMDRVSEGRVAYVTVHREMLVGGAARLLPPDRVVLQLGPSVPIDIDLIEACEVLRRDGFSIALTAPAGDA